MIRLFASIGLGALCCFLIGFYLFAEKPRELGFQNEYPA
jgi:hypothetical protein